MTRCEFLSSQNIAPPSDGLYFTLSGTVYQPGADVGDSYLPGERTNQDLPGPSLVCVTIAMSTLCVVEVVIILVVVLWGIG